MGVLRCKQNLFPHDHSHHDDQSVLTDQLLAHVRAIYIPIAHKSSEKCPDLCTYVHVRFNSLKDFELEYHQDKTPDKQAHLYDFEKAAVSKKKIVCDKTTGIGPDGTLAIGLNVTKLVTALAIPRHLRKADAFSSGGIVAVDSSLIPLVGVQQTLDDHCMVDWTTVAGENQGLTIEWGKGSYEGPWFIAWFRDSMTFAIGWVPLIGPFLAIGWSVAFTAIQDPDNLMNTLRSAIPGVRLTEGLIEEFKKGKALVNSLVEDVDGTVKSEKGRKSQDQKIEQAAPGPKPEQSANSHTPPVHDDDTDVQEPTEENFGSVIASVPSSKAITEEEFKVLAKRAGKAGNFRFNEEITEDIIKKMLIYSHEKGINKVPDNTYGAVTDYNESVKKQYMV